MTIEALEDGLTAKLSTSDCEYSSDNGYTWCSLTAGQNTVSISKGQSLMFRGNIVPTSSGIGTFTISKKCNLAGNCMSLLYGDYANQRNDVPNDCFVMLFNGCVGVVDVSKNFLPATELGEWCYYGMFYGCSSLTSAPDLPSMTMRRWCYEKMFMGCTQLSNAPDLPSTTLAYRCYALMFYNCDLVKAPELPATQIVDQCYNTMFAECNNLNYVKANFITLPSYTYTQDWLAAVSSSGVFVKNKKAEWDLVGTSGVPSGWTVMYE